MSRSAEHPLYRATAGLAALCVLMLTVFAASPGLHAELHGHDEAAAHHEPLPAGPDDHACAVTLFAHGVTALLFFCWLMLGRSLTARAFGRARDEIIPSRCRYRLVPSHAPPAA